MTRYKDSNKYKIYGEDAILAARFDKYLDAALRNCRADYLKALSKRKQREIPYEDLPDAEKETVQEHSAADDAVLGGTENTSASSYSERVRDYDLSVHQTAFCEGNCSTDGSQTCYCFLL